MKNFLKNNTIKLGRVAQVFCLFFIVFSLDAFAQTIRPTTFDNRGVCLETKGIWRQFGDSCADNCEAKFDSFAICARLAVFTCDCGKNRCWNGDECVLIQDYKKIYDEQQKETQKILDAAKEKRKAEAIANQAAILTKLTAPKDENGNPIPPDSNQAKNSQQGRNFWGQNNGGQNNGGQNNLLQNQQLAQPALPQPPVIVNVPEDNIVPTSPITEIPAQTVQDEVVKDVDLPPFVLKKQARDEALKQQQKTSDTKSDANSLPQGLPEIPLPQ